MLFVPVCHPTLAHQEQLGEQVEILQGNNMSSLGIQLERVMEEEGGESVSIQH